MQTSCHRVVLQHFSDVQIHLKKELVSLSVNSFFYEINFKKVILCTKEKADRSNFWIFLQTSNRGSGSHLNKRRSYLHDDDLHAEDLVFCAGFVGDVSKVVHLWRIHLL